MYFHIRFANDLYEDLKVLEKPLSNIHFDRTTLSLVRYFHIFIVMTLDVSLATKYVVLNVKNFFYRECIPGSKYNKTLEILKFSLTREL